MEILMNYGFDMSILTFIVVVLILFNISKKEILKKAGMLAIEIVSHYFSTLDNSIKLEKAIKITYAIIPNWLRWFVTKKMLTKLIKSVYHDMEDYIRNKLIIDERAVKDFAMGAVTGTIKEALELKYNGNNNLVSNSQLKLLNFKAEERVDRKYGEFKYRTYFKDERELIALLGFDRNF